MSSSSGEFSAQPQMKGWATLSVILWLSEVIITIVLFKIFLVKKKENKKDITNIIVVSLSTATFILELIAGIGAFYKRLCDTIRDYGAILPPAMHSIEVPAVQLAGLCVVISFLLIFYIFVARLYVSFNNTVYAYPKCFYIFVCLEMLIVIIITFMAGVVPSSDGLDVVISGIAIFLHILNCIFLTILFIHSLKKVQKVNLQFKRDNSDLVGVMVKFVALLSLAMITSAFLSVLLVLGGITKGVFVNGLVYIFQPMDATINVLCVYLQFRFTKHHYVKWLGKYNDLIEYLFTKQTKTERNLQQEMSSQTVNSTSPIDSADPTKPTVTTTGPALT